MCKAEDALFFWVFGRMHTHTHARAHIYVPCLEFFVVC